MPRRATSRSVAWASPVVGGVGPERPDPLATLGRLVAVDVLIEAAGARAGVARDRAVGQLGPALEHVGSRVVVVLLCLTQVDAWDCVAVVGPNAEGRLAERADPDVVAEERHGAPSELLEVGVRADVGDAGGWIDRGAAIDP